MQPLPALSVQSRRRSRRLTLLLAACLGAAAATAEDSRLQASREVVKSFGGQLKGELIGAMQSGGPAAAILVCRDRAPEIAATVAADSGADLGRVGTRVRNPDNAANEWQQAVLDDFAARLQAGEELTGLEYFSAADGGARYMKAIGVEGPCLTCHGDPSGEAAKVLAENYPGDAATGYAPGDLRGAFWVEWPAAD